MEDLIEQRFKNVSKSKTFKNIVKSYDLNNKSVLDIGCSYGEFLPHFGVDSVGITIDKSEVEYGSKRNLKIILGNIESDDFNLEQKYEAIFANNILEHLCSPHLFLLKIKKYLSAEGILILGVPCLPKILSLIKLRKFKGSLASSHLNFFTRETLIKTVERSGYKVFCARGFHFKNKILDSLLNCIYPHFYIVCSPDLNFKYSEKKLQEFEGYKNFISPMNS